MSACSSVKEDEVPMTVVSTGCDTQFNSHTVNSLMSQEFEVSFRILGSQREGQILRIAGEKFTVGSGPSCTLCLRSPHVAAVHLVGIHGPVGTLVRAMAVDTRLDGRTFADAWIKVGDRLSVGPIDLEVLNLTTPFAAPSSSECSIAVTPTVEGLSSIHLAEALQFASNQVRLVRQIEHARTRRLLAELKSLREKQTDLKPSFNSISPTTPTIDLLTSNRFENFETNNPSQRDSLTLLETSPTPCPLESVGERAQTARPSGETGSSDLVDALTQTEVDAAPSDTTLDNLENDFVYEALSRCTTIEEVASSDVTDEQKGIVTESPCDSAATHDFYRPPTIPTASETPIFATGHQLLVEPPEPETVPDYFSVSKFSDLPDATHESFGADDALAKIRASLASLLVAERTEEPVASTPTSQESEIERVRRVLLEEYQRQEIETASNNISLSDAYQERAASLDVSPKQISSPSVDGDEINAEESVNEEDTDQCITALYRRLAQEAEARSAEEPVGSDRAETHAEDTAAVVELETEAHETPSWVDRFAANDSVDEAEAESGEPNAEHFSASLYDSIRPETPAAPVNLSIPMTAAAEPSTPAPTSRTAEKRGALAPHPEDPSGDDESIDAYMTKLLARLGGSTSTEPARPIRNSSTPGQTTAPHETEALLKQTFGQELQAREQEFQTGPYVPRVAPERMEDLKTLRDVANAQAAAAIDISSRKKRSSSSLLWVAGSVFGVLLGGLLLKTSTSPLSISFLLSIASFGGTIFSIQQVLNLRKTPSISRRFETVKELTNQD